MKIRHIDLNETPITQEHEALHIPPPEDTSNHSVIRSAVGVAIITLIALVILGVAELFKGSLAQGISAIGVTLHDDLFWKAFFVGLIAQAIESALGMAYGITSTSFLFATGASPALASAAVHMAEVFTTGASGVARARVGNVDKKLFVRLLIPGVLGGITGTIVVTQIDGGILKPYITVYLLLMGVYVLSRAFRKKIAQHSGDAKHVAKLAFLGGLLAAPFAAILFKKIAPRRLLILVGVLIAIISLFNLYKML